MAVRALLRADNEMMTIWRGHALFVAELAECEKDENVVLEFKPNPAHDMLVACLWSRWSAPGEPDLLSIAAITDEPPVKRENTKAHPRNVTRAQNDGQQQVSR
jgi:hypothetical protein